MRNEEMTIMVRASGEMQSETKYGAEHQTGFKMADRCLVPCSCPAVGQLSRQIRNNSDWLTNGLELKCFV